MKLFPKAALAACLLVIVSCGGGSDLKSQTKRSMKGFGEIFEGINDKASAEAAVDDLSAAIANLKSIYSQRDQLPPEEREIFMTEVTAETKDAVEKVGAEVNRVLGLPGVKETLIPVLAELTAAFAQ